MGTAPVVVSWEIPAILQEQGSAGVGARAQRSQNLIVARQDALAHSVPPGGASNALPARGFSIPRPTGISTNQPATKLAATARLPPKKTSRRRAVRVTEASLALPCFAACIRWHAELTSLLER